MAFSFAPYVGGLGLLAGFAGGWSFHAGQIAKRDIKIKDAAHQQELLNLGGRLEAKDLEIDSLREAVNESPKVIYRQAKDFSDDNRRLKKENETLRQNLAAANEDYYDIQIPQSSIDRINCAFHPSMCIDPAASGAQDNRVQDGRADRDSTDLAGSPSGDDLGSYPQE